MKITVIAFIDIGSIWRNHILLHNEVRIVDTNFSVILINDAGMLFKFSIK